MKDWDPEPVSLSEFARRCGAQTGSIINDLKRGRAVRLPSGRFDVNHPLNAALLKSRLSVGGVTVSPKRLNGSMTKEKKAELKAKGAKPFPSETTQGLAEGEDISAFQDMTLRQISRRFGSQIQFIDVLNSVKKIVEIEEKEIRNAVSRGKLVSRELVKLAIIGPMETTIPQILSDGSKQLAHKISTMTKAGVEGPELEREAEAILKSFLKPMKDKMTRGMKGMENK